MELGWKSRFEMAVGRKRRIVLHGNVYDYVLEAQGRVEMIDWLTATLRTRGYTRVASFDLNEELRSPAWRPENQSIVQFINQLASDQRVPRHVGDPKQTLGYLRRYLERTEEPSALIISNADIAVSYPSPLAVALHNVAADIPPPSQTDGESAAPRNVAIYLYSRDTAIPEEFVVSDPDTRLVLVRRPTYDDRRRYFDLHRNDFHPEETPVDSGECARRSDGMRFKELHQLALLSRSERRGLDQLSALLSLFELGRDEDRWTNVDVTKAAASITQRGVRGQDRAVSRVVESLRHAKHGMQRLIDPTVKKPAVVSFFVGPTGVGKTMVARALAEYLTGSPDSCKIIDMSEYRQDHSDQKLIGSPPGYVGFHEGGQLTSWVRSRPFSVVLIDEVEKAHERILDLFLQVLDGARLTDGKGETVDFSQTVLIFTSNIGTDAIPAGLDRADYDAVASFFTSQVEQHFADDERPELFNRLKSGIIVFGYIQPQQAREAIESKLASITANVNGRLAATGRLARLNFDKDRNRPVVDQLLAMVDYSKYGLRDVNNVFLEAVGTGLSKFLDQPPADGTWQYLWSESDHRFKVARSNDTA